MRVVLQWRKHHLLLADAILASVIVLASVSIAATQYSLSEMVEPLHGTRSTIYATLASIGGSMLGFILTAVSIIMVFAGLPRFRLLRESAQYHHVFRVFFCAIYALAISTIVALIGLVVDTDASPVPTLTIATVLVYCVGIAWTWRCVWILHSMARIAATPIKEKQPATPGTSE